MQPARLYLVTFRYLTGRKAGQVSHGLAITNPPDTEFRIGRALVLPLNVWPVTV